MFEPTEFYIGYWGSDGFNGFLEGFFFLDKSTISSIVGGLRRYMITYFLGCCWF